MGQEASRAPAACTLQNVDNVATEGADLSAMFSKMDMESWIVQHSEKYSVFTLTL